MQFVRPPLSHNICVNGLCYCTTPNLSHALPYLNGSVYYCRGKGCGKREAKTLLEKLRWVTLGYHYDWNSKVLRSLSNVLYVCFSSVSNTKCYYNAGANTVVDSAPTFIAVALQVTRVRVLNCGPFPIPPHSFLLPVYSIPVYFKWRTA